MLYLEQSEAITGYKVKVICREVFTVVGYTLLVPPGQDGLVGQFWQELAADGRLEKLRQCSSVRPWVLGLGSWDPECQEKGFRYTVCIEETEHTDFTRLELEYPLFRKEIGASDWMCFEMSEAKFHERFWKDNAYVMLKKLGYQFHMGDYSVGLHFDAFPPEYHPELNANMEFWITVKK